MEPTRREKGRTISLLDAALHAVMLGAGESYLGAMAVELGHQQTRLALLLTLPILVGSVAQILSGPLVSLLGGPKRLVVLAAALQAAAHIGFAAVALGEVRSLAPLLAAKTAYWVAGLMIGPPWGAWMVELTEGIDRQRYFAWRVGISQITILIAFCSAGWLLQHATDHLPSLLAAFALLHGVALVARSASALALSAQPAPTPERTRYRPALLREALTRSDWRTASYMALFLFGAHVAVPFFTPYMLGVLGMDYATYAALTAVPLVTKAVAMWLVHGIVVRVGLRAVLAGCTAAIAAVASAWGLSRSIEVLVGAQLVSGLAWAGLEYASYQLLLQSSPRECRVEFLSLAGALTGLTQLLGALLGGVILARGLLEHQHIFLVSAALRALPLLLLLVLIPSGLPRIGRVFFRVVSVRPAGGSLLRPIFTFGRSEESEEAEPEGP